jgi:4-hydroxyphenylpyruvate dioxygenase
MTRTERKTLGIKAIDSLHLFVHDLERSRAHYVTKLDFAEVARSGRMFHRAEGARASQLEAGDVRFLLLEPLGEESECARFLDLHPEGVGRIVLEVENLAHAHRELCARGATPLGPVSQGESEGRTVAFFDIATPLGDTTMRFVEYRDGRSLLPGLERCSAQPQNRHGFAEIDHITSNFLTLQPALLWMEHVLGLERYWGIEFHTNDIEPSQGGGSGLKSTVMWDPHSGIKFANNEPAAPSFHGSQIYRFCADHRGAGVQHIALTVRDIVSTVGALRSNGVSFMPTPRAYYDALPERLIALGIEQVDEPIEQLAAHEILVDGAGKGSYLLQIFLREAAALFDAHEAGPLFLELIQRKGDRGFGAGNFRALFESIERQQQRERAA